MWTKELPTKPGYYWLRNSPFNEYNRTDTPGPDLVLVTRPAYFDPSAHANDLSLEVEFIGTETVEDLKDFTPGEWYGPLYPPD